MKLARYVKYLFVIVFCGLFLFALFIVALLWFRGHTTLADIFDTIRVSWRLENTPEQKDFQPPDRPIVIPFRYGPEGTMLVQVQMEKRQVPFIFDTGSSSCVLWEESVPADVLVQHPRVLSTRLSYCNLPDTQFGGVSLTGSAVNVEPRWCKDAQNSAGLLGGSLFKHFDVIIDHAAKQITLSKHVANRQTSPSAIIVPMQLKNNQLFVKVNLGTENTIDASIDTGCLLNSVKKTELKSVLKEPIGKYIRLKKMKIGGVELDAPIFAVEGDLRPTIPPLIGNGTLSQYQTILDYQEGKLILEPIKGTHSPVRVLSQGLWDLDNKEFKEAISEFTDVIKTEPELGDYAYAGRAECFDAVKGYQQAIDDYSKVLLNRPAWAYSQRGYVYQKLGLYEKSIDDYGKSISLFSLPPKEVWLPEAEAPVRAAEGSKVWLSWLYSSRAWSYRQLSEYRKAVNDLTKSIELRPKESSGYTDRALCYEKLGAVKESEDDYGHAIRLAQDSTEAYIHRARFRAESKDYQGAIEDYTKAIALDPKNRDNYYFRSLLFAKTGHKDLAKKDMVMADKRGYRK